MLERVLIVLLLLLVIPDTYIYLTYVNRWTSSWWKKLLFFLPSVILFIYFLFVWSRDDFLAVHQPMVGTLMIVFLLITCPKMLFTLIDAIGLGGSRLTAHYRRAKLFQEEESSRNETDINTRSQLHRYIRLFAMAVGISSALMILYGYFWGRRQFQVNEQSIYFQNLPKEFDGYRILHFSDLHIGTYGDGSEGDVDSIVNLINRQQCDMVVFTGDLVNYESAELVGYTSVLRQIKAKDGVYSVLGNHDYDMYLPFASAEEKRADMAKIKKAEQTYGWHLLLNENRIIRRGNDSIAIIGSENDGLPPWPSLGDLHKASRRLRGVERTDTSSTDSHTFSVLLTHDPTHWHRKVIPETLIDLTLSGHTHAGQFKLFGWSPVSHKYSEWSGVYTEGSQVINVTDGIGQIMLPFRFGAWPEIDIITLKKLEE